MPYKDDKDAILNRKNKRQQLRLLGICTCCHKNPSRHGLSTCEQCKNKYNAYAEAKRAKRRKQGVCACCGNEQLKLGHVKCDHCYERDRKAHIIKERNLKIEVFSHYGGVCGCCKEDELTMLTIDHINGGGTKHRRSIGLSGGGGQHFYKWLKDEGFPSGYRVLCINCNLSTYNNSGICAHKFKSDFVAHNIVDQDLNRYLVQT